MRVGVAVAVGVRVSVRFRVRVRVRVRVRFRADSCQGASILVHPYSSTYCPPHYTAQVLASYKSSLK